MQKIEIICPICGHTTEIELTDEEYDWFITPRSLRPRIQDFRPDWSPEKRELFISNLCYKCQKEIFG